MSVFLCVGVAGALAWAQFRSFDLLDGGYYFLLYQDPADNPDTYTRFQLIARPIWLLFGQNIVAFRFATLALITVACLAFCRALKRHFPVGGTMGLLACPLWLSAMAGLTWVPVALTYNSFSTFFSLIALAILLVLDGPAEASCLPWRKNALLAIVLLAVVVGLFLVKPPASAALVACGLALFFFSRRRTAWQRRLLIGGALLLFLAALVSAPFLVTHSIDGKDTYLRLNGVSLSPRWARENLVRYSGEFMRLLPSLAKDLEWTIIPTIFACGAVIVPGVRKIVPGALALLLVAMLVVFLQRRLWDGSFSAAVSGEAARFYFLLWCALLPVWVSCMFSRGPHLKVTSLGQAAWIFVLFVLPLMSSFGSTNTPYVSALHETVFWAAGLVLLAGQIAEALTACWFRPLVAALLCLGAAGHIFTGHFLRPYMWQSSLWNQTQAIEIGSPATVLKLDPPVAHFLADVRAKLEAEGYRPGDDVFGFFNLPGVIYALGAKEPGAPWYFGTWYVHDDTDGIKLRRVPIERRRHAWIITQADVTAYRRQFLESGVDFPDGYRMIGKTINPTTGLEIGIWKPLARR